MSEVAVLLPTGNAGNVGQLVRNVMTNLLAHFPDLDHDEHPESSRLTPKLQTAMADQLSSYIHVQCFVATGYDNIPAGRWMSILP